MPNAPTGQLPQWLYLPSKCRGHNTGRKLFIRKAVLPASRGRWAIAVSSCQAAMRKHLTCANGCLRLFGGGLDPQHLSVGSISQNIKITLWPLAHIADALAKLCQ